MRVERGMEGVNIRLLGWYMYMYELSKCIVSFFHGFRRVTVVVDVYHGYFSKYENTVK